MFGYKLFRPLKELKAAFNFKVFNRVNGGVFVDTARHQLYYMPTVEGEQSMNAFFPVDSEELKMISQNINKIYDYYKSKGFAAVYLAIIPNPVTVIHPDLGKYNDLIPRIYSMGTIRMPIFDVYRIFKSEPQKYYSRSDSHWNNEGMQMWINEFNKKLEIISNQG